MIGFDYLGKLGRFCNQMFQYSFLYNAGKKTGLEIGFDFKNNPEIASIFKLEAKNSDRIIQKNYAIEKNDFAYFDSSNVPDGTDFFGYFQNSKYVEEQPYNKCTALFQKWATSLQCQRTHDETCEKRANANC